MRAGRRFGLRGTGAARALAPCAWLTAALLAACDGPAGSIAVPELPPERDASYGVPPVPDGAILCERDRDCDDGVDCTRDTCVEGGYCVSASDASRCDDGEFCNGFEVCDPADGCRKGSPQRCNDDDVCTIDYCDEEQKACVHAGRDFDGDGEIDWHCVGGTDCNDFDVTQAPSAAEICSDGVDNDCDEVVDERRCGQAKHDLCDDALDVSAGGRFQIDLGGTAPNYVLGCLPPDADTGRDVAYTFTTDKAYDVRLAATGLLGDGSEETATIVLRRNCDDVETEVECSHGFPGQVRVRALPPGRYYAIASSALSSRLVLDVRFSDATEPPSNRSCDAPLDISAGGHFEGDFTDVGDDTAVACNPLPSSDLFYQFTLEEEQDVELSALSKTGERMHLAVRRACDDDTTTLRCMTAAPARGRLYQLPAGTYYVVLEGPSAREIDFNFDVAFLPPTAPPPGGGCGNPLPLPLESEEKGLLTNLQDFVAVDECGCKEGGDDGEAPRSCGSFLSDIVYRIDVDEPTDLRLRINGGAASIAYHLRASCDEPVSEQDCGFGTTTDTRLRNLLPGDYYLVLESAESSNFSVQVDPLPPTVPTEVTGNDTCASAREIPSEGGLFAGDTLDMSDDYQAETCDGSEFSNDAVFRLLLNGRSRVTATLQGPFDTVLYMFADNGRGPSACDGGENACNDDGGPRNRSSLLDLILEAGTYYYVVDGFNSSNEGAYLLDVSVSLP